MLEFCVVEKQLTNLETLQPNHYLRGQHIASHVGAREIRRRFHLVSLLCNLPSEELAIEIMVHKEELHFQCLLETHYGPFEVKLP